MKFHDREWLSPQQLVALSGFFLAIAPTAALSQPIVSPTLNSAILIAQAPTMPPAPEKKNVNQFLNEAEEFQAQGSTDSLKKALDLYYQALAVVKSSEERLSEADILRKVAVIHTELTEYKQALDAQNQSLKILLKYGSPKEQSLLLLEIGDTYFISGNYPNAITTFKKVVDLAASPEITIDANIKLARVYEAQGDLSKSQEFLQKADSLYKKASENLKGDVHANYFVQKVYYATDRKVNSLTSNTRYIGDRGNLQFGLCNVSIPVDHKIGEIESPSLLALEFESDPNKHITLLSVQKLEQDKFIAAIKKDPSITSKEDALIFIHGFNTTFDDAARGTAQLAYDLQFKGTVLFFSWPSKGDVKAYPVDRNNAEWAVPDLVTFLKLVSAQTGVRRIHLIAHSMGNYFLTEALRRLSADTRTLSTFDNIILTAPDIDADIFKRDIAPVIKSAGKRTTLYASSNDLALKASRAVNGYARAGDSGNSIVIIKGIDSIDVSSVNTTFLGHSYYGDNRSVISDIFYLLKDQAPEKRSFLLKSSRDSQDFWIFKP
jgi:esterase/lipase superfamily enzyme